MMWRPSPKQLERRGTRLFVHGRGQAVAEVVRDSRHCEMWRFRLLPDGAFSDMVNLSRAKDAARRLVLSCDQPERGAGASRIARTSAGALECPAARAGV